MTHSRAFASIMAVLLLAACSVSARATKSEVAIAFSRLATDTSDVAASYQAAYDAKRLAPGKALAWNLFLHGLKRDYGDLVTRYEAATTDDLPFILSDVKALHAELDHWRLPQ